jgi:hypothetical protein
MESSPNNVVMPGRKVILNLGLAQSSRYSEGQGVADRAKVYHAHMHHIMCHPYEVSVWFKECETDEDTLVVRGSLNPNVGLHAIRGLCKDARQDCIAVFYRQSEIGTLIGPHADDYGNFDINLFKGANL